MAAISDRTSCCAAMTRSSFPSMDRSASAVLCIAAMLATPAVTTAAEWSLQPAVRVSADHDSNRTLTPEGRGGVGTVMEVDALLAMRTERLSVTAHPTFAAQRFTDDTYANSDNHVLDLGADWTSERSRVEFAASQRSQSTLLTESLESGILDSETLRDDQTFSVTIYGTPSARFETVLRLAYADVSYEGGRIRELPGYRYPSLYARAAKRLSPLTTLSASLSFSELTSPGTGFENRDASFALGIERQLSARTSLTFDGGISRLDNGRQQDQGFTGALGLRHSRETASWELGLERSVQPSGTGVLVQRLEGSASYAHEFSSRFKLIATLRSVRNDSVLGGRSGERRRLEGLEARADWRLSPHWNLGFVVGAARAQGQLDLLVDDLQYSEGWRGGFSIAWLPQRRALSR